LIYPVYFFITIPTQSNTKALTGELKAAVIEEVVDANPAILLYGRNVTFLKGATLLSNQFVQIYMPIPFTKKFLQMLINFGTTCQLIQVQLKMLFVKGSKVYRLQLIVSSLPS